MRQELKYQELTGAIIKAAIRVHEFLGVGFQEYIYQRALEIEMQREGLEFTREVKQNIYYRDLPRPIGSRRADFVVARKVLIEVKAISELEPVHQTQILNYLNAFRLEVGLLINFGEYRLNVKRMVLSEPRENQLREDPQTYSVEMIE